MEKIHWRNLELKDCPFFLSIRQYEPGERFILHNHDFCELMMIRSGSGRQILNTRPGKLGAGDLFFIRPEDSHSFKAGIDGLELFNCAFPETYPADIEKQYFTEEQGYFRNTGTYPQHIRLAGPIQESIAEQYLSLATQERSRFSIDLFLMTIYHRLRSPAPGITASGASDWLIRALKGMQSLENLRQGTSRLVQLSGRSREHVSRETRKYTGVSPSEYVLNLKLTRATDMLSSIGKPVTEVAFECGFENLSYFHRCFRKRFGISPLQYRKLHQSVI